MEGPTPEGGTGNVSRLEILALAAVLAIALGLRLTGLQAFIANDEIRWTCRSLQFRQALTEGAWEETMRTGHPGVITMWLGAAAIPGGASEAVETCRLSNGGMDFDEVGATTRESTERIQALGELLFDGRVGIALFTWIGIGIAYFLARLLWGPELALLSLGLIALEPFLLALSRVLHIDAVLGVLMTLSFLSLLAARRSPRSGWGRTGLLALSGGTAGLAMLEKTPAIFLVPFTALLLVVEVLRGGRVRASISEAVRDLVTWIVTALSVYIVLWPAMWVDPVGTLREVWSTAVGYAEAGHEPGSYFFGQPVHDPGWGYYPVVLAFRLSPTVLAGLAVGGAALVSAGEDRGPRLDRFSFVAYAVLFVGAMSMGAKKLDRYLLPVFPILGIAASAGILRALDAFCPSSLSRPGTVGARSLVVALLGLLGQLPFVLPHYPHYLTYYNPLVGGGNRARHVLKMGWGEGYERIAAHLNGKPDAEHLEAVTADYMPFAPLFDGAVRPMGAFSQSRTDYVIFYISNVQRRHDRELLETFYDNPDVQPEYTATLHGVEYAWAYANMSYLEPLSYLEEHGKPDRDILLLNEQLVLANRYEGNLEVRAFAPQIDPPRSTALLDGLEPGVSRVWYPHAPDADSDVVGRLLRNRALIRGERSFPGLTLRLYELPSTTALFELEDVQFGDVVLRGYQLTDPRPAWGRDGGVFLHWGTEETLDSDYTAFVHLYDTDGERIAQGDGLIVNQDLQPTSEWRVGDSGRTLHHLSIPVGTPPGTYGLRVGVYDVKSGDRVPRTDRTGTDESESVHLETEVGIPSKTPDPRLLSIPHPLDRQLVPGLKLLGYGLSPRAVPAGQEVELELFWQARAEMDEDYQLRLMLRGHEGTYLMERDLALVGTGYGTSQWQVAEIIREEYMVPIDAAQGTGELAVELQLLTGDGDIVLEEPLQLTPVWIQSGEPGTRPALDAPSDSSFRLGDRVTLAGLSVEPQTGETGDTLSATLYWRATSSLEKSYKVFVHVYDQAGNLVAQSDDFPGLGIRPTTSWEVGELVAERHYLDIPQDVKPGPYSLAAGMYDPGTGERLPAFGPDGARLEQDRVPLGTITLE